MTIKITEVVMPQLGVNDETVTVTQWMCEEGAEVKLGQTLATLETTKATFDLECEEDGYFYPLASEGVPIPVQHVIALILSVQDSNTIKKYKKSMEKKHAPKKTENAEITLTAGARKLVEKYKVDIAKLPTGRIIREKDIQALLKTDETLAPNVHPGNALQRIVIYGASEGGDCVADLLRVKGGYEVVAFLEDNASIVGGTRNGIPIRSGNSLELLRKEGIGAVTTHIANPQFRMRLLKRTQKAGLVMLNAIHPSTYIASTARIGVGNLIKAGAVIDSDAVIGDCCIIDNGVIIPHHNKIGTGCHLAPGVSMGGGCVIGDNCIIGIGSSISPRISIGHNAIIGVGSVVVRDVPENVIVEGSPAKVIGVRKS